MARPLSKTSPVIRNDKQADRLILRALYYKQNLPQSALENGSIQFPQRLAIMEISGLVKRNGPSIEITDAGIRTLIKLYGGKKPPLVDFKHDAMLDVKGRRREFIVGSSLAGSIARAIRVSE